MAKKRASASPADTHEDVESTAESSTAEDVAPESSTEEQETMLDAIVEAVSPESDEDEDPEEGHSEEEDEGGEEAPDGAESEDPAKAKEEDTEEADDTGEDLKPGQRVPFDRFQKQIKLRDQYKQERDAVVQERDQYRQGHENFSAIVQFRERNNLTDEDVVQALKIAGAINRDPAAALEQLQPIVQQLNQLVGNTLPADLQARVDSGELAEQDALALSRTQSEAERLKKAQQANEQEAQQRQTQEQQVAFRRKVAMAVTTAEKAAAAKDPDFDSKRALLGREIQLRLQTKYPSSEQEAVTMFNEALTQVNAELAKLTRRPPVRKGPSSQGTSTSSTTEPATMLEAMERAVDQS